MESKIILLAEEQFQVCECIELALQHEGFRVLAAHDIAEPMSDWQNVSVYYAAIRSEGAGRVRAVPGLRAPLVTYSLSEADMSRLARGLVHLGEVRVNRHIPTSLPRIRVVPISGPCRTSGAA